MIFIARLMCCEPSGCQNRILSYHHFVFIATHSEDDDFLDKWALHESEWLHEKATTRKRFHLVIFF